MNDNDNGSPISNFCSLTQTFCC